MPMETWLLEKDYIWFDSDDPAIRCKLRQLSHSFSCALAERHEDLAQKVRQQAYQLKAGWQNLRN